MQAKLRCRSTWAVNTAQARSVQAMHLFYNGRDMRGVLILALLACMQLLPAAALAQAPAELAALDSRGFQRSFGPRQVSGEITLRAGGEFRQGRRAYLQVDLDSAISGAAESELAGAVVVNGFVVLGLPPGLEPDGEARLLYYDSQKGRYEFMYSKAYPNLTRLEGLGEALESAAGNDPQRILAGLGEISRALDPAVEVSGPTDPRLTGGDPSFSVTGVSWLIPCNVWFDSLVNLFDPEDSIEHNARLRVSLPVKITSAILEPKIAIYAGGLSAAMAKVELLPADIPPTGIPLAPLPEALPPAAQPPADAAPPAGDGPAKKLPAPVGKAAEQKAKDTKAPPAPPPPPTPIPALIYSYDWVTWETELDISALVNAAGAATPPESSGEITVEPAGEPPASAATSATSPEAASGAQAAPSAGGESVEVAQPQPPEMIEPTPPAESEPATESAEPAEQQPPTQPAAKPAAKPAEKSAAKPVEQESGVREVKPGTLPDEPETYTVPLKPITGAGGTSPQGEPQFRNGDRAAGPADQGAAPSGAPGELTAGPAPEGLGEMVLIPEGYFLMGTGGSSSAGDADELPQQQVYLPAYSIDKYPVTNRQFMEFVLGAGYKPEGHWDKYYSPGTADLPVRGVTWNDASAFAKWAHKRLPTEAEWEKAARGVDGRTYPWGEDWSADILPRGENLYQIMTAPVGASPFGVMGMVGLVWQWTASVYAPYPFNPDASGDKRVLRGGCYSNGRNVVRCANRYAEAPNVALNTFGFRCVKDAK
jgi:formylglycine-generating enzyme required for sulfatase activity